LKKYAVNVLVLTLALLLVGCGFQLRGTPQLPDDMSLIYIDSRDPRGPFARELRRLLDSGDARVVWDRKEANAILRILSTSSSREILSVNLEGRPQEIRVAYQVEFDMRNAEGDTLIERQQMNLHRDISTDADDPLGAGEEARRMIRALEEDIVQSVVLRIEALARQREVSES